MRKQKVLTWFTGNFIAGLAQLVEHDLAKVGVASSSLVSRSVESVKSRFYALLV
jgi:hypothetical protein